jgi:hypothetical protein
MFGEKTRKIIAGKFYNTIQLYCIYEALQPDIHEQGGGDKLPRGYMVSIKKVRHPFFMFWVIPEARLYSLETWNQNLNSASPLRGYTNL